MIVPARSALMPRQVGEVGPCMCSAGICIGHMHCIPYVVQCKLHDPHAFDGNASYTAGNCLSKASLPFAHYCGIATHSHPGPQSNPGLQHCCQ